MSTELHNYMAALGAGARKASRAIAAAPAAQKNQALLAMAQTLRAQRAQLAAANARDLEAAAKAGLEAAMVDRLTLTDKGIEQMAQGLEQVAALADPVGEITDVRMRPSGIRVGKMRAPIGVIGIVYEARPNVTADAAALCLKAGNAAILRGGKEALHCNQAIAACVRAGLAEAGLPETVIQVVNTTDRALVDLLVTSPQYVDVIVPRGGKGLIERITDTARVPVIKHLDGNCHVFVDDQADAAMVVPVIENAKTQRYGTCNTAESLLLTAMAAETFLPAIGRMFTSKQVQMRCCPGSYEILRQSGVPADLLRHADETDWHTEFLGPVIAVKIVADVDEAIAHINEYGSGHTDAILTEHYAHAMQFLREVDSASVMVNASTRFADGFEYGLGAEIGISTDRIHARGPVGLEGLTNQKWIVLGSGQVRG